MKNRKWLLIALCFCLLFTNLIPASAQNTENLSLAPAAVTTANITGAVNIAPWATTTASSIYLGYSPDAVKDNIINGFPNDSSKEWCTDVRTGAWIKLIWDSEKEINKIRLYDRPNASDQILRGTLTFSDGFQINVGELENTATQAAEIEFATRTVTWVKFTIDDVSPTTVAPGLAEFEVYEVPSPPVEKNVALYSSVTVSSAYSLNPADAVKDSMVIGYPYENSREWASDFETAGAWCQLSWNTPQKIDKIRLYDRINTNDQILSGTLTFSNGGQISVGALANDASYANEVSFPQRTVTWVRFTVDSVSETTFAAGLSEFEVFGPENASLYNYAPGAIADASSVYSGSTAGAANDSVIAGYPADFSKEWASNLEKAGAWSRLTWSTPTTINVIKLYDRPNSNDRVLWGTLTFSDGTKISVGALPEDGVLPEVISFPQKTVTWVKFTVDKVSTTTIAAGLSEFEAYGPAILKNISPKAVATASPSAPEYTTDGAVDGVISGYPVDNTGEWASNMGKSGTWYQLTWDTQERIKKIQLYDRPNADDQILSGTLTFSDQTSIKVGPLPNDASQPLEVSFAEKNVSWVRFTVNSVSDTTYAAGLAEFEVYATGDSFMEVNTYPVGGQTTGLEPEVLDFKYKPRSWWSTICPIDSKLKTVVASDGGLNYDYFVYPQYIFYTTVSADFTTEGTVGEKTQHIWDAKTPILVTEQQKGSLKLRQEAWSNVTTPDDEHRVDHILLTLSNPGTEAATGYVQIKVKGKDLTLDGNSLKTADGKTFVYISSPVSMSHSKTTITEYDASKKPKDFVLDTVTCGAITVEPGSEAKILVTICCGSQANLQPDVSQASSLKNEALTYWGNADIPYGRVTVPDTNLQNLVDSSIRNLYQMREMNLGNLKFCVGPAGYHGTYAVDGGFILETMAGLGRTDEARKGIMAQIDSDDGPPDSKDFSKVSGLRLWAMWRHAQVTNDMEWLRNNWWRVEREVNKIYYYRSLTSGADMINEPNYKLMPKGLADGGIDGSRAEYSNNYWNLVGLKSAIEMASKLNKFSEKDSWQTEFNDFWYYFDRARNRDKAVDDFGNIFVRPLMQGESMEGINNQSAAWAFMHAIYPGRLFSNNDALMKGTVDMIDACGSEGLVLGTGWIKDGIWNYFGSFYAHAHLELGNTKKSAATLYAFANHASPNVLAWREEHNVQTNPTEQIVGDMPHNWGSAELIRLIIHSLAFEREQKLHLLEGLPKAWTDAGEVTKLVDVPTTFGNISLTLTMAQDGNSATIRFTPPQIGNMDKVVLHLEHFERNISQVKLNGQVITQGNTIEFPANSASIIEVTF